MLFGKAGVAASHFSQRVFITRLPRKRLFTAMAASSYKYVIIGGGNATGYAADEFVNKGLGSDLAIISAEPVAPYERPALSKAYLFPEKPARLPGFHTTVGGGGTQHNLDWYKEQGIDYKTSTMVKSADLKAKSLTTESGDTIGFEKLILATGCSVMNLADFGTKGADLGGIFYLRDVTDADAIVAAIPEAKKKSNKAVVVGGGYIGLETAAALNMNGLDVTLVFPEDRFMARLFTPAIADFYEKYYADKGITIRKGDTVSAFEGEGGKVTTVVLKSGDKIPADMVLVGVGAKPNVDLVKGQVDLLEEKPGGIKVDGKLQTSNPDVYAIGDVAAFPLGRYGVTSRQEHVTNARMTGKHVVSAITDPSSAGDYDYLPFFYSRIFDLSWQFYGVNNDAEPVFFGNNVANVAKFGTYFIRDGKVVGVFLESGSPEENAAIKKVADTTPTAPDDLAQEGLAFAKRLSS